MYREKLCSILALSSRSFHRSSIFNNTKSKNQRNKELHSHLLTMPKESGHIKTLIENRKAKKESATKYPAGIIEMQILGNGAKGAPQCLYLFTDQTRYLFNCGEGTQRLAHEHKRKLAKLEHIFITHKTWDRIGGLPGIALTIQDIGIPCINLHGPVEIEKLFEGTSRFAVLNNLMIKLADSQVENGNLYHDDHILRVDYIPIYPNMDNLESLSDSDKEPSPERDDTDYYQPIKGLKRHFEIIKVNPENSTKKTKLLDGSPSSSLDWKRERKASYCYVCKPKEKKGTLILDRCIDFGVPPGPLYGKLKNGEDVTLPNGTVVRARDCKTPDFGSSPFLIIDCPKENYLESLLENEKLLSYQNATGEGDEEKFPQLIVHFTPEDVLKNPKYLDWMEKFGPRANHLIFNESCNGLGSEGVHIIQNKLNLIDKNIFPMLNESNAPFYDEERGDLQPDESLKPEYLSKLKCPTILTSTLMGFKLRPPDGLQSNELFNINPKLYIEEAYKMEGFTQELERYLNEVNNLPKVENQEYPRIIFLGTGSSIPNKTRATSAILVEINEDTNILLDCAEGTLGQLVRLFGDEEADSILVKMKAIYVSHLHADHHLGLIKLLQSRSKALKNLGYDNSQTTRSHRVLLIAPAQIMFWLNLYGRYFESIRSHFDHISNQSLNFNDFTIDNGIYEDTILATLGLESLKTCFVRHCKNAFGIALTHKSGWKLTYSGDTMPCDNLITLGKDSDVLIHEATMEDDLKSEAKLKLHSTTSQAIDVGKRMNAKFTILTHFSQRYSRVPLITGGELERNVGLAFDNMMVRLTDLPKIALMYPVLIKLFSEHFEEMQEKTQKLLMRREREEMIKNMQAKSSSAI